MNIVIGRIISLFGLVLAIVSIVGAAQGTDQVWGIDLGLLIFVGFIIVVAGLLMTRRANQPEGVFGKTIYKLSVLGVVVGIVGFLFLLALMSSYS